AQFSSLNAVESEPYEADQVVEMLVPRDSEVVLGSRYCGCPLSDAVDHRCSLLPAARREGEPLGHLVVTHELVGSINVVSTELAQDESLGLKLNWIHVRSPSFRREACGAEFE